MILWLRIQALVPEAQYSGDLEAGDETAYNAITWTDVRTKPTWSEILAADEDLGYEPHQYLSIRLQNFIPEMAADIDDTVPVGTLLEYAKLRLYCNNISEFMGRIPMALELHKAVTDLGTLTDTTHEASRQLILTKLGHWIP